MDGSRSFWGAMTTDAARERELLEERKQPFDVFALRWISFGIRSFQIHRSQHAWSAMPRSSQENCIEIVLLYEAIQVNVTEAQPRTGSPVTQQSLLDVLSLQRFPKQRIVLQINHPHGQVIARSP